MKNGLIPLSDVIQELTSCTDSDDSCNSNKKHKAILSTRKKKGLKNLSNDSFNFIFNRIAKSKLLRESNLLSVEDIRKVQKVVGLVSEVVSAAAELPEKPRTIDYIHCGFKVESVVSGFFKSPAYRFFDDDKWICPFNETLSASLSKHLKKHITESFKEEDDGDDDRLVHLAVIENVKFGWMGASDCEISCLYVEKGKSEEAKMAIHNLLWSSVGTNSIILRADRDGENPQFLADADIPTKNSKLAEQTAAELAKYLEKGHSRSLLFYGPPGTGKSTIIRYITHQTGMRTIRFRVEDLPSLDNELISACIDVFKPAAVVFDDLDRSGEPSQLLETLERFHDTVKLVMASVNEVKLLTDAFIRPGRFDEAIPVMTMEEEIVKSIINHDEEIYEIVKNWPVAFIHELRTRLDVLPREVVLRDKMADLQRRVDRMNESEYGFGDELKGQLRDDDFSDESHDDDDDSSMKRKYLLIEATEDDVKKLLKMQK